MAVRVKMIEVSWIPQLLENTFLKMIKTTSEYILTKTNIRRINQFCNIFLI